MIDHRPGDAPAHLLPDGDTRTLRFLAYRGTPPGPTWRPAVDLFETRLDELLAATRERTGCVSDAVAGSLLVEQYCTRLLPPLIALAYEHGQAVPAIDAVLVDLDAGTIGATFHPGEPVALDGPELDTTAAADLARHLEHLARLVHLRARTPRRVLRGAAAHAVTTAFLHLSWPRHPATYHLAAARTLLGRLEMSDLVRVEAVRVAGEDWLYAERRSCCLAFRAATHDGAPDRYCATCPVTPEAERRSTFAQAAGSYRERTGSAGPARP